MKIKNLAGILGSALVGLYSCSPAPSIPTGIKIGEYDAENVPTEERSVKDIARNLNPEDTLCDKKIDSPYSLLPGRDKNLYDIATTLLDGQAFVQAYFAPNGIGEAVRNAYVPRIMEQGVAKDEEGARAVLDEFVRRLADGGLPELEETLFGGEGTESVAAFTIKDENGNTQTCYTTNEGGMVAIVEAYANRGF